MRPRPSRPDRFGSTDSCVSVDGRRAGRRSHWKVAPYQCAAIQGNLEKLGEFGRNPEGGVTRLGFSQIEMDARTYVVGLMKEAGLKYGLMQRAISLGAVRAPRIFRRYCLAHISTQCPTAVTSMVPSEVWAPSKSFALSMRVTSPRDIHSKS